MKNWRCSDEFWAAVENGELDTLRACLDAGAEIECWNNAIDFDTPLRWACTYGLDVVALELIKRGANVNSRGHNGVTPLMLATHNGRVAVVLSLLANGADVNASTTDHQTALTIAQTSRVVSARPELLSILSAAATGRPSNDDDE